MFLGYKTPYNRPGLSVLNYANGVVINDGTNYADAAFAAALAAARAIDGGNKSRLVYVPRGTYQFQNSLNIDSAVTLIGESGSAYTSCSSALVFNSNTTGIIIHRSNTSPSGGDGGASIIQSLAISSDGTGTADRHGIQMFSRCAIRDCYIGSFAGDLVHIAADTVQCVDTLSFWAPSTAYKVGDQRTNGTAWAPSTVYLAGQQRINDNGKLYTCVTGGVSAASGGPVGTGGSITDGTVVWSFTQLAWYICKVAGTSASSGGPTGTSTTITDGGVTWGYVSGTNANGWLVQNCRLAGGQSALRVIGGDANAGKSEHLDIESPAKYGIWDSAFLSNLHIDPQVANSGLGPWRVDNINAKSIIVKPYAEDGQPAGYCALPSQVWNPQELLPTTGGGLVVTGNTANTMNFTGPNGPFTLGGSAIETYPGVSTAGAAANLLSQGGFTDAILYQWAGLLNWVGFGWGTDSPTTFKYSSELARTVPPNNWLAALGAGPVIEGKQISFANTPGAIAIAQGGFGTRKQAMPGDINFVRDPAAGAVGAYVCTVGGCNGTYAEGLTATSAGGTSLTLSGNTGRVGGLCVGDRILVNGVTDVYVTARPALNTLTVSAAVPAGSGLSIAYVAPTWLRLSNQVDTAPQDDTGSPATSYTQNTTAGKFTIKAGEHLVTVNNSLCTASSIVLCNIIDKDTGIAGQFRTRPLAGGFVFETFTNAAADCKVMWVLRN